MAHDDLSHDEVLERFAVIANNLGVAIFPPAEQLTPSLEVVVDSVPLRSLRDFDEALSLVNQSLGAGAFSAAEARAIVEFRHSVKKDYLLGAPLEQMRLEHAVRDGRLIIEEIGKLGRKLTVYPAPRFTGADAASKLRDRPPRENAESRLDTGAAPDVEPSDREETVVRRLDPSEDGWTPTEIAALCVNYRGVRFLVELRRASAQYLQQRLMEMGIRVEVLMPKKRRAKFCTMTAWLDSSEGDDEVANGGL